MSARFKSLLIFLSTLALLIVLSAAWLFYAARRSVPVVNYHQINDTEQNSLTIDTYQFEAQIKYLVESGYTPMTIAEMIDAWDGKRTMPKKPVVVTFDDGYVDNLRHAFPILEKYNVKATIFVITDYIGLYPNYLTWEDAKKLQDSGLIDIESHTLSHQDLTRTGSDGETRWQLTGSKQAIEWRLNAPVRFLAYPCGRYDERTMRLAKESGYAAAFGVHYGLSSPDSPRLALSRIPVFGSNTHTLLRFKLRLELAPLIEPLNDLKLALAGNNFNFVAGLIVIP